jgi:hypothetical protein
MIDDFEHDGTGYEELDRQLQTYASARLTPSSDAVRRMRKAVVLRAADLAAIRQFEAERLAAEQERLRNSHAGLFGWLGLHRRASAALLAASMTIASVGVVFGASADSPLYPARIWLQSVLLPGSGDARAAAHVDLLEQRVEDAEHAAGGADAAGVQAALTAYISELESAIADAQNDPARLAELQQALAAHLLLLQQLENSAPAGAQNAIHQAINDSRQAQHDLAGRGGSGGGTNNGGTNNGNKPTPTPAPTAEPPSPNTPDSPGTTPDPSGG